MPRQQKILFVFANPRGTDSLRLGEEDRAVTEAIRRSKHRDDLSLNKCHAATIHDLRRALLDDDYDVVHISGHGTASGLLLESEDGGRYVVPQKALAKHLSKYAPPKGHLRCVVLNSCYSVTTGSLISLGIPHTVVMEGPVSDDAAIEFTRGFYDAVGAGKDLEFAYQEGCDAVGLAAPGKLFASQLINKGETYEAPASSSIVAVSRSEPDDRRVPVLVGLAVDVSGSMSGSIRNEAGSETSRLEGFREALDNFAVTAKRTIQETSPAGSEVPLEVFAYGFGLRHRAIQYCDLLSLVQIARDVVTPRELDSLTEKHTRAVRRKFERTASQYGGLADIARQYLGNVVSDIERFMRAQGEQEVRDRVMAEVADRVATRLDEAGETTLSIGELASLWEGSGQSFEDAEPLIFGSTPMRAAMEGVLDRFTRELSSRPSDTLSSLFLLSDGEPTDGSPESSLDEIRNLGVTVISCFVTDHDVAAPRTLFAKPQEMWPPGAVLMFRAASRLESPSDLEGFLLAKGWEIHDGARLFVQLNHSEILEEFMNVLLVPLRDRGTLEWQLPSGL